MGTAREKSGGVGAPGARRLGRRLAGVLVWSSVLALCAGAATAVAGPRAAADSGFPINGNLTANNGCAQAYLQVMSASRAGDGYDVTWQGGWELWKRGAYNDVTTLRFQVTDETGQLVGSETQQMTGTELLPAAAGTVHLAPGTHTLHLTVSVSYTGTSCSSDASSVEFSTGAAATTQPTAPAAPPPGLPDLAGLVVQIRASVKPPAGSGAPCRGETMMTGFGQMTTLMRSATGVSGDPRVKAGHDEMWLLLDASGEPAGPSGVGFGVSDPTGHRWIISSSFGGTKGVDSCHLGATTPLTLNENRTNTPLASATVTVVHNPDGSYTATITVPGKGLPPTRSGNGSSTTAASLKWKNCAAVNKRYPHGIGRAGAHDKRSGRPVTNFKRSTKLYKQAIKANGRLDGDKDGIACEKH